MARFERYAAGQFSWVDLMTPNLDDSLRFYGSLFGWMHLTGHDDQGSAYSMQRLGDLDVAGMGEMPAEMKQSGMPPVWNSYVTVEDADATAARAQELGAKLQMPVLDIRAGGDLIGRTTVVIDPEGAYFSIWQPGRHAGSAVANEPGSFCWNELCTHDPQAAAKFYGSLFGWEVLPGDADNGYRLIKMGERMNGGMLPWQPQMGDYPPSWAVYFAVADCDATVRRVQELGGKLMVGPVDIEPGRFALVADPLGAVFYVMYLRNPDD